MLFPQTPWSCARRPKKLFLHSRHRLCFDDQHSNHVVPPNAVVMCTQAKEIVAAAISAINSRGIDSSALEDMGVLTGSVSASDTSDNSSSRLQGVAIAHLATLLAAVLLLLLL